MLKTLTLVVVLFSATVQVAFAQGTTSISGTVLDPSGAAISGASITVRNTATGLTRNLTSDAQGHYLVPDLPIGEYEIQGSQAGFQTVLRKGIELAVGAQPVVDFHLPVGQAEQTINVQSEVSQVETTSAAVSSFVNGEAPVAVRGSAPDGPGYWFAPTVLCPVDPGSRAAREEIFGPVATVIPFDDEEHAVRLANDTIYGLSGSIWTRDGARALRVARAIDTGVLSINSNTSVRVATPFGGFKQSGYGRELGPHALDAYTEVKSIYYATS